MAAEMSGGIFAGCYVVACLFGGGCVTSKLCVLFYCWKIEYCELSALNLHDIAVRGTL